MGFQPIFLSKEEAQPEIGSEICLSCFCNKPSRWEGPNWKSVDYLYLNMYMRERSQRQQRWLYPGRQGKWDLMDKGPYLENNRCSA